jgi:hypothetical protein
MKEATTNSMMSVKADNPTRGGNTATGGGGGGSVHVRPGSDRQWSRQMRIQRRAGLGQRGMIVLCFMTINLYGVLTRVEFNENTKGHECF